MSFQNEAQRRRRGRTLRFESLEDRSLLAADPVPVAHLNSTPVPIDLSPEPALPALSALPSLGTNMSVQSGTAAAAGLIIAETAADEAGFLVENGMLTQLALDAQTQLLASANRSLASFAAGRAALNAGAEMGLGTPPGVSGQPATSPTSPTNSPRTSNRMVESPLDPSFYRFLEGRWWQHTADNQWLYWDGNGWQPLEQPAGGVARGNQGAGTVTR